MPISRLTRDKGIKTAEAVGVCSGLGEGCGLERSEPGTKVMLYFLRVPLQGAYRVLSSGSRKWSSQCELCTS